ncbi:zinc finger BED domain-containing protein RICESLEEPER 3-like [Corylus avellana]|uniref:zinc finger BED domain-containing protein RICESLEEPER 3-like n=1 Tax=Corylus avellana TaxID=13451 RepID=UPI00286CA83B|nr:zinc finger BED domain-containing protein RICESLEEPER 3-like [Corylus avellana]
MNAYAPTSATSSCPIDDEELETYDDESDEFETDTQGIRCVGSMGTSHSRGGRPPIPGKKRLRVKRSSVWDHFTKDKSSSEEFSTANCNYCGRQYKCHPTRNGTSNILYHFRNCEKYKSLKAREDSSSKFTFVAGENQISDASGNNLIIAKYYEKIIRETLCEMIIVDEFPFSVVEKKGVRKMFRVLEPRFTLPSCYTMMKDCVKLFMTKRDLIKKKLLMAGQRICLTTDTWTSIQNMNYMVIIGHFIDHSWKYHKRILAFCQVSDHKAITITKEIEQCLVEWGIKNLLAITLDNATANDKAMTEF